MEHKGFGGVMELFCILNVVVVTYLYAFFKTHRTLKNGILLNLS